MAANQLSGKADAAHWVLLIVALLPMATSLLLFNLSCSLFDRHTNKVVGIIAKPAIIQVLLRRDIRFCYKACRHACRYAKLHHRK